MVELVIVRDKSTHESKGSAFVWYATRAHAERAILQVRALRCCCLCVRPAPVP